MEKKILVTGATGKQGRALIAALQPAADTPSEFQIIALTRNVASPAAVSLKSFPNVRLAQADLDRPETVKKVFEDEGGKGSIWGMYVVLAFPGLGADASGEEKQGKVSLFTVDHLVWLNSNLRDNRHAQIWLWSTRCHTSCSHLSNEVVKLMTRMPSWTVWLRFTLRTT